MGKKSHLHSFLESVLWNRKKSIFKPRRTKIISFASYSNFRVINIRHFWKFNLTPVLLIVDVLLALFWLGSLRCFLTSKYTRKEKRDDKEQYLINEKIKKLCYNKTNKKRRNNAMEIMKWMRQEGRKSSNLFFVNLEIFFTQLFLAHAGVPSFCTVLLFSKRANLFVVWIVAIRSIITVF